MKKDQKILKLTGGAGCGCIARGVGQAVVSGGAGRQEGWVVRAWQLPAAQPMGTADSLGQ